MAGLPVYLELPQVVGLSKSIQRHPKVRKGEQDWIDAQIVMALVLLNLADGSCADALDVLESDSHPGYMDATLVETSKREALFCYRGVSHISC